MLTRNSIQLICSQKPGPKPKPGQALVIWGLRAWPVILTGPSRPKPGPSRGFRAKPGPVQHYESRRDPAFQQSSDSFDMSSLPLLHPSHHPRFVVSLVPSNSVRSRGSGCLNGQYTRFFLSNFSLGFFIFPLSPVQIPFSFVLTESQNEKLPGRCGDACAPERRHHQLPYRVASARRQHPCDRRRTPHPR